MFTHSTKFYFTLRYQPEVGDVVVGRITGIIGAKWKVDINAKTASNLPLVSINLPSGVQVSLLLAQF